jgi:hypothetical protein
LALRVSDLSAIKAGYLVLAQGDRPGS